MKVSISPLARVLIVIALMWVPTPAKLQAQITERGNDNGSRPQEPSASRRQGFWLSVGMGAGSLALTCDGCDSDRETALSGNLRLGGTVSPKLLLGVGTFGWTKEEFGEREVAGYLLALVSYYPSAESGFYVQAGAGLGMFKVDNARLTAPGFGAGLGVDIPLGRSISLTPWANALFSTKSELKIDGDGAGVDLGMNLIQGGLAITFP